MTTLREAYLRDGFVGPLRLVSPEHAARLAAWIGSEMSAIPTRRPGLVPRLLGTGRDPDTEKRLKTRNRHLDSDLISGLVTAPEMLGPVHEILGDRVKLWRTQIFKMGGGTGFGWHTDEYRGILSPITDQLSTQIAFTPFGAENCVQLIPGSHLLSDDQILAEHGLTYLEGSREIPLFGSSRYRGEIDAAKVVSMILQPGEFYIFHPNCLHRSSPTGNQSPGIRLAMACRIASASTTVKPDAFVQTRPRKDHEVLLRRSA